MDKHTPYDAEVAILETKAEADESSLTSLDHYNLAWGHGNQQGYLRAKAEERTRMQALVKALRVQEDLEALHDNWLLGVPLSAKYHRADLASSREMVEYLEPLAKQLRQAALAAAKGDA